MSRNKKSLQIENPKQPAAPEMTDAVKPVRGVGAYDVAEDDARRPQEPQASSESAPCVGKFGADRAFRELLHRKIEEALESPDPILYSRFAYQFFADGEFCPEGRYRTEERGEYVLPLRFEPYTIGSACAIESGRHPREMAPIEENESWFKLFWQEQPEVSFATAIRTRERERSGGKRTPQEEAKSILLNAEYFKDTRDALRNFMVECPETRIPWVNYCLLRDEQFLRDAFQHAMMMKPLIFSMVCESTLLEMDRLVGAGAECCEAEVDSLSAIQKIMLEVLRKGVRAPGMSPVRQQRVSEVTKKLEKMLGVEEQAAEGPTSKKKPGRKAQAPEYLELQQIGSPIEGIATRYHITKESVERQIRRAKKKSSGQ